MEIYEEQLFETINTKLSTFNFDLSQYVISSELNCELVSDQDTNPISVYTLKEIVDFVRENGRKGITIQRYKGLGEMNPDQLWETTMDPEKRTLVQVTIPDAIAADHMFSKLMGEEVAPRREFIEKNAKYANLDV